MKVKGIAYHLNYGNIGDLEVIHRVWKTCFTAGKYIIFKRLFKKFYVKNTKDKIACQANHEYCH